MVEITIINWRNYNIIGNMQNLYLHIGNRKLILLERDIIQLLSHDFRR